jgi:hypothetical protein
MRHARRSNGAIRAVRDRTRRGLTPAAMLARELAIIETLNDGTDAHAVMLLVDSRRVVRRRLAGARRLPRPFDVPDRAAANLRSPSAARW